MHLSVSLQVLAAQHVLPAATVQQLQECFLLKSTKLVRLPQRINSCHHVVKCLPCLLHQRLSGFESVVVTVDHTGYK